VTAKSFDIRLEVDYPALAAKRRWGSVAIDFHPGLEPEDSLISNVNLVPFCGDGMVVLQLANGRTEMPGGTREPGEAWPDTLRRELVEEAGAKLVAFSHIGAWRWVTSASRPYRPHLPFPTAYRLVGYGDVELIGAPTNPPDGEQVVAVDVVSIEEAEARFRAWDRGDIAELYRLAYRLRTQE
jgi:8-oxo-dGTP pyrophosphatase MutT (NUDIX family)